MSGLSLSQDDYAGKDGLPVLSLLLRLLLLPQLQFWEIPAVHRAELKRQLQILPLWSISEFKCVKWVY